jgi:hypothetical protein
VTGWRDSLKELTEIKEEANPEESQPRLRCLDLNSITFEELVEEISE